jgi:hypothetical protein
MAMAVALLAQRINALNGDYRSDAAHINLTCNQVCSSDDECKSGFCYEPPAPECDEGKVCANVIQKVCRFKQHPADPTCDGTCTLNTVKTIDLKDRCTTTTFKQANIICQNGKHTTVNQADCVTKDRFQTLGDTYCQSVPTCQK